MPIVVKPIKVVGSSVGRVKIVKFRKLINILKWNDVKARFVKVSTT